MILQTATTERQLPLCLQLPFNVFYPPDDKDERGKPSQIVSKETEDAARFKYLATGAAAGVKKATSAQLEYISHGVPGRDMVEHQLLRM